MTEEENFLDLSKYKVSKRIGIGNYGIVSIVKDKESKKKYAAKTTLFEIQQYNPKSKEDQDNILFLYREIKIMSALDHPCIIKYIGYNPLNFDGDPFLTIISEYAPNGTL